MASEFGRSVALVVDDHESCREFSSWLLRGMGFDCLLATGQTEALAHSHDPVPTLILLDLHLADGDGMSLARKLRMRLGHKPLMLAVSGNAAALRDPRLGDAGFDGAVLKPLHAPELKRVLTSAGLHAGETGTRLIPAGAPPATALSDLQDCLAPLREADRILAGDRRHVLQELHRLVASARLAGMERLARAARDLESELERTGTPGHNGSGLAAALFAFGRAQDCVTPSASSMARRIS